MYLNLDVCVFLITRMNIYIQFKMSMAMLSTKTAKRKANIFAQHHITVKPLKFWQIGASIFHGGFPIGIK